MAVKAKGVKIKHPEDIYDVVKSWARRKQENFLAVTLNGKHEVIKVNHVTKGLVNRTITHPRESFFPVIKDYATSVVFVHNHPSGDPEPSQEDKELTKRLCIAGKILGFNVLDHIIIAKDGLFSLRREGFFQERFSLAEEEEFFSYLVAERK